jgi:hypothetical protein
MKAFGLEIRTLNKEQKADTISPYLVNHHRLADLITAIQVMGSYKYASRFYNHWAKQLGTPLSANNWYEIFKAHPEFFIIHGLKDKNRAYVTLRWRFGFDNNYWAEKGVLSSPADLEKTEEAQEGLDEPITVTKKPLESEQIESLINTAIELHGRAIAFKEEKRWLIPVVLTVVATIFSFLGAIIGAYIGAK